MYLAFLKKYQFSSELIVPKVQTAIVSDLISCYSEYVVNLITRNSLATVAIIHKLLCDGYGTEPRVNKPANEQHEHKLWGRSLKPKLDPKQFEQR